MSRALSVDLLVSPVTDSGPITPQEPRIEDKSSYMNSSHICNTGKRRFEELSPVADIETQPVKRRCLASEQAQSDDESEHGDGESEHHEEVGL